MNNFLIANYHILLAIIASSIQIFSLIPYIWTMLKGKTRPNAVSWALWTLIQTIAIFAQISAGASWSLVLLITMTMGTALTLTLALVGYGYKEYGWIDLVCLVVALGAIAVWQITNEPLLAIVFAIFADFIAAIPTIYKIIKKPFSENLFSWNLIIIATMFSIFSSAIFNLENLLFQGYLFTLTLGMSILIYVGQKRVRVLITDNEE